MMMMIMINVYAPPESTKCFFKTQFDTIAIETEGILICGGDYNVVMNHNLDTTSPKRSKKHLSKFINTSVQEMGLIDVWRELYKLYTLFGTPFCLLQN